MYESVIKNFETALIIIVITLNAWGFDVYHIPENKVVKVIDGDTLEVYQNNKIEKIRMIGLNTPETVDPRRGLECFGIEASARLKNLLEGKIVKLEEDETQGNLDKFGRSLRYVLIDNVNINQKMIEEGYGFEYTYKKPYKYQKEFKRSQEIAKENNIGLWNEENCQY